MLGVVFVLLGCAVGGGGEGVLMRIFSLLKRTVFFLSFLSLAFFCFQAVDSAFGPGLFLVFVRGRTSS